MENLLKKSDLAMEALQVTKIFTEKYPNRLSGSEDAKKSAKEFERELAKHCDSTTIEEFEHKPESLLGFLKITAISYALAMFMLLFNNMWFVFGAVLLFAVSITIAVSQFVFYKQYFDWLWFKKKGYNVIGKIEPEGEVKQQIVISGHHDSAHVFNFFQNTQKWYSQRILMGMIFIFLMAVFAFAWGIMYLVSGGAPTWYTHLKWIGIVGLLFTVPYFWFTSKKISPGAGDNMIASAVSLELAKVFGDGKKAGKPFVKNTRLMFISFDAEEAGLRGSRAYTKAHKKELTGIPTYVFNLDSLYNIDEMHLATSEINGTVKNSKKLAEYLIGIGDELGYKVDTFPMVFGGGATDAASFAQIGVEATTLVAMSVEAHGREGLVYHTQDDKVEYIEPAVVEASIDLGFNFIMKKEKELLS